MPKASISDVEARNRRLKQKAEEKKNEERLKKLELDQQEAKDKSKKELDEKVKKANK